MKALFAALGSFFLLTATVAASDKSAGTGPSFKGPLGLQMYSLRFYSPSNAVDKLDKAHELGFRTIEGGTSGRIAPEEYQKLVEQRGLKLVSTGCDFATLKRDPESVVSQAKKLGAHYVMCSWIPHPKN